MAAVGDGVLTVGTVDAYVGAVDAALGEVDACWLCLAFIWAIWLAKLWA